jgi:hypothetical protein
VSLESEVETLQARESRFEICPREGFDTAKQVPLQPLPVWCVVPKRKSFRLSLGRRSPLEVVLVSQKPVSGQLPDSPPYSRSIEGN